MSKNLSELVTLNISGSASFTDNDLPNYSFCAFTAIGYYMTKVETIYIDPTNSELNFGTGSFSYFSSANTALTSVNIPKANAFGNYAFYYADKLTSVNLPNAQTFGATSFSYCKKLTTLDLPSAIQFAGR